ncbi:gamma-glutamyl hydrolase-like isoform X2 [Amphiura filiformis]|uniref:gamma-glutamyl hydrolase-like isoform X2 n=1 Tax=Amphiura filiformis TaxID=82378 RepID=UPI003B224A44
MIIRDNLIVISLVILIGALFLHCDARGTVVNDRPIIGILSQTEWNDQLIKHGDAYLAASYVKYIESAGARVAPVFVNQTQLYYNKIFNSVNGLLLPGGGQLDLLDSGYGRAARYFYDMAMKSYDAGNYFPIWGSCFGFEILSMLTAGKDLRTSTKAIDISYPLNISKDYKSSHLMKDIPNDILNTLTTVNMTFNYHHWGISPTPTTTPYMPLCGMLRRINLNGIHTRNSDSTIHSKPFKLCNTLLTSLLMNLVRTRINSAVKKRKESI